MPPITGVANVGQEQSVLEGDFIGPDPADDLGHHAERDVRDRLSPFTRSCRRGSNYSYPTAHAFHATGGSGPGGTHSRSRSHKDATEFLDVVAFAAPNPDLDGEAFPTFEGDADILPADGNLDGVQHVLRAEAVTGRSNQL